ncbi:hypothetical protein HanIR_Chr13g0661311 [Helianthus annuus]|nr:hypothetical protein HanIR_Chr13g0661311 [Helianthus annuus]
MSFFNIPLKIGKNIYLYNIRGYNTYPHDPRAHVEYADMTHTSPFRCVRCSEPALAVGLNRISETREPDCLHSLQASNPSCPVHNRRGYMNTFFNKRKEGYARERTSATLSPEPSRATSDPHPLRTNVVIQNHRHSRGATDITIASAEWLLRKSQAHSTSPNNATAWQTRYWSGKVSGSKTNAEQRSK